MNRHELQLLTGLLAGVLPHSTAFGVTATALGLIPRDTLLMSATIYAGASQFSALSIIAGGGSVIVAVLTVWLLNLRFLIIGLTMPPSLTPTRPRRLAAAHLLIDPSLVLRTATTPERRVRFFWQVSITLYVGWLAGTSLGVFLGSLVPDASRFGFDVALPTVFVAVLASFWSHRPSRDAALASAAASAAAVAAGTTRLVIPAAILGALVGLGVQRRSQPVAGDGRS